MTKIVSERISYQQKGRYAENMSEWVRQFGIYVGPSCARGAILLQQQGPCAMSWRKTKLKTWERELQCGRESINELELADGFDTFEHAELAGEADKVML